MTPKPHPAPEQPKGDIGRRPLDPEERWRSREPRRMISDNTHATAGDLFALIPSVLEDGRHELLVTGLDGRWKMTVLRRADGAEAEITLGAKEGPARSKRLRLLLGRAVADLDEARELLVGKEITVRLTSYEIGGRSYRGIER